MSGDNASSLGESVYTPLPLSSCKMSNDESSCTSAMAAYFVRKRSYGPNHPHQRYHEDHLVIVMEHSYTPLLLVEGYAFCKIMNHIDLSIRPITRSKLTQTLINYIL